MIVLDKIEILKIYGEGKGYKDIDDCVRYVFKTTYQMKIDAIFDDMRRMDNTYGFNDCGHYIRFDNFPSPGHYLLMSEDDIIVAVYEYFRSNSLLDELPKLMPPYDVAYQHLSNDPNFNGTMDDDKIYKYMTEIAINNLKKDGYVYVPDNRDIKEFLLELCDNYNYNWREYTSDKYDW